MGAILCAVSNFLHIGQKIAMWAAAAMVFTCLILTLFMMLGLGVGLGYNYCFVDVKTKHRYRPGHYVYELRRGRRCDTNYTSDDAGALIVANETRRTDDAVNKVTVQNTTNTDNNTDREMEKTILFIDSLTSEKDATCVTETPNTQKTVVQIDGLDLITLLTKLRAENRSYTIQIVTS